VIGAVPLRGAPRAPRERRFLGAPRPLVWGTPEVLVPLLCFSVFLGSFFVCFVSFVFLLLLSQCASKPLIDPDF